MALSDTKLRNSKPKDKPYKLADESGLFVLINPAGSKLWRLKYHFLGKERLFSIGPYPVVGLADARAKRDEVKKLLLQGIDPTQHRRTTKMQKMEASQNTFEAVARRWMEIKNVEPSHQARSLRRLELHAFPRLGFRPIDEIKTIEIASCLEAIERGGVIETANRVKQIIQQVFRYAVRRGLIEQNPAGDLRDIISHCEVQNRACIRPAELPQLLRDMAAYQGDPLTIAAMKLLALTFVRTGELIGATWEEIDWDRCEWKIPAERMKMRNEHLVPLATQSVAILKELHKITGRREFLFFSAANKDKFISNNCVLSALKRMGYNGRMTGHGFRALASTVLNEQRKYHPDIIEKQLAHADRNEVRAIYNRADYLLERKKMMQDWANFLDKTLMDDGEVVQMFGRHAQSGNN